MNKGINTAKRWAIVPAAGIGSRVGGETPKQYLPLLGQPVITHTLKRLAMIPGLQGIVVALHPEDRFWPDIPKPATVKILTVTGGDERCTSVYNALQKVAEHAGENDWMLVHDAARPCVRIDDINVLLQTVENRRDGGLLATKVTDTMKRGDADGAVAATVERDGLWRAMTPQAFRLGVLREALQTAIKKGEMVTDDAQAVERLGLRPLLVEGNADNFKITLPQDLQIAELFLRLQGEAAHKEVSQ